MIDDIEKSYERIACAIIELLPEQWSKASAYATFYDDGISWELDFVRIDGSFGGFTSSAELVESFIELRNRFKESGQALWGQATFLLSQEGNFKMEWGYENCNENGNTVWDSEAWNRRQNAVRFELQENFRNIAACRELISM